MEAKDIKWCPQHGYPLPCHKCGMPLSQTQQQEIFKAGMEEEKKGGTNAISYLEGLEEGEKRGIRKAVDYLKMHYCIVATEEMIKKLEEDK